MSTSQFSIYRELLHLITHSAIEALVREILIVLQVIENRGFKSNIGYLRRYNRLHGVNRKINVSFFWQMSD